MNLESNSNPTQTAILKEIALYFLRLGSTGFGGPLAMVSQMERDLAGRWVSKEEFAQVFAAIKTLPGPVAFQVAVFLGYERGGQPGAALAALCFLAPSAILMTTLGLSRTAWIGWSGVSSVLIGFQAAALGLILASVTPLSKAAAASTSAQKMTKWSFAVLGFGITLFRPSLEPLAIIACGVLAMAPYRNRLVTSAALVTVPTALIGVSIFNIHSTLFFTALKSGALVFGSGLAIVPLLGGEFVDQLQWITHGEFLEALMFGQMTPGPILTTITYIGARVAGVSGALVATVGIFLVPYVHMTTWFPRVWKRIVASEQWARFSFGAISAVIGAVFASVIKLLEPVVLAGFEIEDVHATRQMTTFALWLVLPVISLYLIQKKKQPGWAVVLASGIVSFAALFFF